VLTFLFREANQQIAINNAILEYHHIHLHGYKVLLVVMNYVTKLATTRERHRKDQFKLTKQINKRQRFIERLCIVAVNYNTLHRKLLFLVRQRKEN
jgi:hypothetical protein